MDRVSSPLHALGGGELQPFRLLEPNVEPVLPPELALPFILAIIRAAVRAAAVHRVSAFARWDHAAIHHLARSARLDVWRALLVESTWSFGGTPAPKALDICWYEVSNAFRIVCLFLLLRNLLRDALNLLVHGRADFLRHQRIIFALARKRLDLIPHEASDLQECRLVHLLQG